MNEPTTPIRCARCRVRIAGASGVCSDCHRRLCSTEDRRRRGRHYSEDDDINPWQENAIRILEDME